MSNFCFVDESERSTRRIYELEKQLMFVYDKRKLQLKSGIDDEFEFLYNLRCLLDAVNLWFLHHYRKGKTQGEELYRIDGIKQSVTYSLNLTLKGT